MKQHRLFCNGQRNNPKAVTHLQRVGHFEFGKDRRPINVGDSDRVRKIMALWEAGNEVEGWALYWDHVHRFVADRLDHSRPLRQASLIIRYEALCREPAETTRAMLDHCVLAGADDLPRRAEHRIRFPTYYQPQFSEAELEIIEQYTADTAARLGIVPADDGSATPRHRS